jgi:hypothetical protein
MSTAPIAGMTPADEQSKRPSAAEALASGGSQLERRLVVALSGGMLLLVSWLGNAVFGFAENVTQIPAAIGAIIVATPLFAGAVREVRNVAPNKIMVVAEFTLPAAVAYAADAPLSADDDAAAERAAAIAREQEEAFAALPPPAKRARAAPQQPQPPLPAPPLVAGAAAAPIA